jgi:hypothetical protein
MCVISWRATALPNVRLLGSTKGCTKVPNSDLTSMEETHWVASSDATPMGEKSATALRQVLISGQRDLKSQIISCQTVASYYCERFLELLAPKLKAEGLCKCTVHVYIFGENALEEGCLLSVICSLFLTPSFAQNSSLPFRSFTSIESEETQKMHGVLVEPTDRSTAMVGGRFCWAKKLNRASLMRLPASWRGWSVIDPQEESPLNAEG